MKQHFLPLNPTSHMIPVASWPKTGLRPGVTCGARHRRIIALNLANLELKGTIPSHVGNLSFLQSINLSNNSFDGRLPHELTHLNRLKHINLGYNNFVGEIPSGYAMLPKLQDLLLNNNSLVGTIPSSLFNISTLEMLMVESNFLEGNIPEEIGNLSSLQKLSMGYNQLSGVIPFVIFNLSSVRLIDLQANSLSGSLNVDMCSHASKLEVLNLGSNQLLGQIPASLYKCMELQVLNLEINKFSGMITKEIGSLDKITELFLRRNNLTGTIPNEMGNLYNLQELDLSSNSITGSIPSSFFNFSMLRRVNLASNNLLGHLSSSTGLWLPNLEELYLQVNEFTGPIPDSISNVSKLSVLDISSNFFFGFVPHFLGNLRSLQKLNMANNFLTTRSSSPELSFLSSLINSKHLTYLRLDGNPLNESLPISMGNLSTSLQFFYAANCEIKGNIPRQVGNLSNVVGLILQNNELTGTIPGEIGRLQYLQDFSVAHNKLQGHIPSEICHLQRLGYLFLRENGFSGPLPSCLNNLTSIRELYLGSNRFTSTIPSALWSLTDLLHINLSFSSLSGSLPSEIGNLKVVTTIDLSSNQLSGDIPATMGNLQNIAHLSLSGNRLQGSIPQSFGDMVGLEFLNLSDNNLSGVISKSLEKLLHLDYFNVSFNQLEGEIPNGGPFTNFSSQSFIGNEALCGSTRLLVPQCGGSSHQSSKRSRLFVFRYIWPTVSSAVLLLAFVTIFIRCYNRKAKPAVQGDLQPLVTWRRVSYRELELATNGFEECNLLGTGSFGSVYKGTLSDGSTIAIKVFNLQLQGAFQSFGTECEVLRNLRHRNLVKIISSCCNLDCKALILEFMPNYSLEKWLYSHNNFLDIFQRLNIMVDVASALEYLHHGCISPVVHCDLKPSNVLLNKDLVAQVGDFGIAKLLGEGDSVTHTMTLATIGYMAPEYGLEGSVSVRCDIYSYGILLMETFTRKKPTDEMFVGEMNLGNWVQQSLPHAVAQVVDTHLLMGDEEYCAAMLYSITSILKLALECTAYIPEERIGMKDVLATLKKIQSKFMENIALIR